MNQIGDPGAVTIAEALCKTARLTHIHFGSDKSIRDQRVLAFGTMLACNTSLLELSLTRCNIGNQGAASLKRHCLPTELSQILI